MTHIQYPLTTTATGDLALTTAPAVSQILYLVDEQIHAGLFQSLPDAIAIEQLNAIINQIDPAVDIALSFDKDGLATVEVAFD